MSKQNDHPYTPIGERRHACGIELPVDKKLCARYGRSVVAAIREPARCTPTMRRVVRMIANDLRSQGMDDAEITARLSEQVQCIAQRESLDDYSIMTGKPRWREFSDRVGEWIAGDRESVAIPSDSRLR